MRRKYSALSFCMVLVFALPFWNIMHDGPAPKYGITFGVSLLYPGFWQGN